MIKVGMIVRYSPKWCSPGEEKYLHIVKENRLNPITNEMTRWLIETINTGLFINPTETVEEEMIEPVEFNEEVKNMIERCMNCGASFDIDESEIISKLFITDVAKMADFKILSKEEFLTSYSYLTEDEYEATRLYFNWLMADDSES